MLQKHRVFFAGYRPLAQTGSGNAVHRGWLFYKGTQQYFWVKARRDISSRFRDRPNFFRFLGLLPVAILDFFENRSYTGPLIFRALHDAFYRLSIGRLGAEQSIPFFLALPPMGGYKPVEASAKKCKSESGYSDANSSTLGVFGVAGVVSNVSSQKRG